jgi:hypothetical protein
VFGGALRDALTSTGTAPKDIDVSLCIAPGSDFATAAEQIARAALQVIKQDKHAPAGQWRVHVVASKARAQPKLSSSRPRLQLLQLRAGKDGANPTVSF